MRAICQCGVCPYCTGRHKTWKDKTPEEKQAVLDRRNKDRVRANDQARYERDKEKRLAAMRTYQATPEGRAAGNAAKRRWAKQNYYKRKAQVAVGNAVRDGRLIRTGICEHAGSDCRGRVTFHHDDYTKPLEVRELCQHHHHQADVALRAEMRFF